jgi:hypothetical protein
MCLHSPVNVSILLAVLMLFVWRFGLMMASGFAAETFQFLYDCCSNVQCTSTNVNQLLYVELWQRFQTDDLCSGFRFSHARGIMFCTVSVSTVKLTKHLGDLSVLHSVQAYREAHHTSWRSVCSAQCPCLLWGSPKILEICLFCTVPMPTVRLVKPLGDLSVLHSVHVYCEAHQTSLTSNTGTHFSFSPSHRGPKRDYIKMLRNLFCYIKIYKHRFSFLVVNVIKF